MKPVVAVLASCVLLTGCTAQARPAARASAPVPSRSSTPSVAVEAPPVQMQVGTDYVKGVLVRACSGEKGCEDGSGVARRSLKLTDERLLMFAIGRTPRAASLEVTRTSGRVVDEATLRPGTTMPYAVDLKNGRYRVVLDAEWRGLRARWVFGLIVDEP